MAITMTELARALELSKGQVSKLAQRGMPTHDVAAAEAWRTEHLHPAWAKRSAAAPGVQVEEQVAASVPATSAPISSKAIADVTKDPEMSYHVAKTLREVAEAQMAVLRYRTMKGELAPRAELHRQLEAAMIRASAAYLRDVPRRAQKIEFQNRAAIEQELREYGEAFFNLILSWQEGESADEALDAGEVDADA